MSFFFYLWQLWVPLRNEMIDLKGFIVGVIHFSNITGAFAQLVMLWGDILVLQMLDVAKLCMRFFCSAVQRKYNQQPRPLAVGHDALDVLIH